MISLVISSILLLTSIFLFQTSKQNAKQVNYSIRDLQAYFLALGGMQHAELKVRYFPTELYDAVCYSLGRNPYFDFTELSDDEYNNLDQLKKQEYLSTTPHPRLAGNLNPGPRFISAGTISPDNNARWSTLVNLDPEDSDPSYFSQYETTWFRDSGWPREENGNLVRNSDLYLWKYRYDISNRVVNSNPIQPALVLRLNTSVNPKRFDASVHSDCPYEGWYEVTKLTVLSIAGNRRLNEEAIKFSVQATVIDPITKQAFARTYEKTLRIKRK